MATHHSGPSGSCREGGREEREGGEGWREEGRERGEGGKEGGREGEREITVCNMH